MAKFDRKSLPGPVQEILVVVITALVMAVTAGIAFAIVVGAIFLLGSWGLVLGTAIGVALVVLVAVRITGAFRYWD